LQQACVLAASCKFMALLVQKMLFGTHFRLQIYCISANKAPTAPLLFGQTRDFTCFQ
jgi:hypothetical protein